MAVPEPTLPDYDGANLVSVVPALVSGPGRRPRWVPEPAREARQIVLFVVDGLGWLQLQDRLHLAPNLASMVGGAISSVAPSTTACALTSLVSGSAPARHGILGYRVVVEGPTGREVMNVLKWRTPSGDAREFVDPLTFQRVAPFGGRPIPVVSRADFAGTGFTEAHQHGARQVGWVQPSGLAVEVRSCLSAGEPFVYAYYDGIDRIAHVKGLGPHYDAELVTLDRMVGDLLDTLPTGAALVVTADHGQVEVGSRAEQVEAAVLDSVDLMSGEARFRWLHAKDPSPRGVASLADATRDRYGDEAWVLTRQELEEQGWLGGALDAELRRRVGDVALVPFEPIAYLDRDEGESNLCCRHGSLTADEMLIPLVASSARGGRM